MVQEDKNENKKKKSEEISSLLPPRLSREKKEAFEKLKKDFQECEKEKKDYLAGWQRARADFLNYKKEEMERIEGFLKYAQEEFVLRILPVLDNFDLAAKNLPQELENDEIVKGLFQIKIQLNDFLKSQKVEEIKSVGEKFDPNFHEAIEQVELKDKEQGLIGEEDKSSSSPLAVARVVEEIQKGYKINGRLLRPAKVKVTK